MRRERFMEFESFDGKKIFVNEWLDAENPRGIVQIVHGMVEYGGRYAKFAEYLNSRGYLVVADDHRGHGKTDPDSLGYCAGDMFADTVRDEGEITAYYKSKYPELKFFVLGFSYGSFLTQCYLGKYGKLIDGAVIAGSNKKKDFEVYLGSFVAGTNILFGRAAKPAKMIEKLSFGAYAKRFEDKEWLSNDAENNARYHADPFCSFTCSYRFYADFFRGLKKLYTKRYAASLPAGLPLLLAAGREDPVGDMGRGMQKLYVYYKYRAGMRNVTLSLYPDSRHEFLNERNGQEKRYAEIADFFDAH